MKRLFGILFVLLLSMVIPMADVDANEAEPYQSDTSVSFYGEYKPTMPGTGEPQELTIESEEPAAVPQTKAPIITTGVPPSSLPQTGDSSNLTYVYVGLVLLVSCILIPKSKMQLINT
ncbi:LPXTG cell wall anchor domain-containing protein [Anaerocolumna sedimenticola]|uniref:LPXTG cell wall anchor domain-containing protein n=1 Tax=Anaerocolumna sedimenticola TaxID=2696063 RepID=A0A6P1TSB3_9FIRM|nr:LPXTG cell wall anchor domain-containing protein [Anaerocolumna sedimenticola]QHQ63363.1 LPXTG cell wall anchor domain-containing protein [Anaerocolumna sedimenticola]